MIKVLNIAYGLGRFGGIESFLMQYYSHMNHDKVHFDFLFLTSNTLKNLEESPILRGSIVHSLNSLKMKGNGVKEYFRLSKDIRAYLSDKSYDVIHIHTGNIFGQAWLALCIKDKCIRIAHSHSTNKPFSNCLKDKIKKTLSFVCRYIICSKNKYLLSCSLAAGVSLYGKTGVRSKKFKIVNNAIDVSKYVYNDSKRNALRKECNASNSRVFGFVGRLSPEKNVFFLLEVFYEILKIDVSAQLWIVGDGIQKMDLISKTNELSIHGSVVFWGERTDVPDLMQAMDGLIMPSLYEGLSLVAIEAQAASLPVFASESISVEHKITDLVYFIGLYREKKEWAIFICDKMRNPQNRIDRTSELINAGYEINNAALEYEQFYQDIITEARIENASDRT